MGFSELKAAIDGISSKVLSTNLETLEKWGVIERDTVTTQPLRVEYSLTEGGEALEPEVTRGRARAAGSGDEITAGGQPG